MTEHSDLDLPSDFSDSLATALGGFSPLPEGIQSFTEALLTHHRSAVRCRLGVASEQLSFPVRPIDWYQLGFTPSDADMRPSRTLDYAAGDFFLQDAGSMLALAACDADAPPRRDRLVCDLCAAPGGKSSALLESIGDGFLLANEPIKSRIAPLAYNLARTGNDRYVITSQDPEQLAARLGGIFDLVLVDAPCSGQALLGRGKQSLAAVSSKQIEHSAARGRRILDSALQLLRPGGQLVLSTCTFAEAENEDQVRWMIAQDGVHPAPVGRLADYLSSDLDCTYRLWPQRHDCAGSFAASVRYDGRSTETKSSGASSSGAARKRSKGSKQRQRLPDELSQWFDAVPQRTRQSGAVIWGWPDGVPDWVESIAQCGPELVYRTGQTWKPAHAAALRRTGGMSAIESIDVDAETATAFLAGQPIACALTGWCVVKHNGRALGWVKSSRGTGKNHLPAAARLNL
ncbi:SAM-dependent methyltransferase [Stieleria sp. TO1_6]|uniref:methyltransferase RsmF C-terminal domain-like protein n=1 Tax=Stieleria tagensis TaxID=2956795 RepID=UPI00209B1852|nr:SAM-dependent methyltransferase [Stieleria tagensis]MCO8124306.1 SAM-dependent methyltransferase [Stieleria tagensis]